MREAASMLFASRITDHASRCTPLKHPSNTPCNSRCWKSGYTSPLPRFQPGTHIIRRTMSGIRILKENWEEYNKRKIMENHDPDKFSCNESWEVDFLVSKIRRVYRHFSEELIKNAIKACCNNIQDTRPRKDFVNCVMMRLRGL